MYTLNLLLNCLNSIVLVWNSGIAILHLQALGCRQNEVERGGTLRQDFINLKNCESWPYCCTTFESDLVTWYRLIQSLSIISYSVCFACRSH